MTYITIQVINSNMAIFYRNALASLSPSASLPPLYVVRQAATAYLRRAAMCRVAVQGP